MGRFSPSENRIKLAKVLRCTRKDMELGQIEFASKLGISQSYVSKLERGQMMLPADLWMHFCDELTLGQHTLLEGVLDDKSFVRQVKLLSPLLFKISEEYLVYPMSKVRALLPLISLVHELYGSVKGDKFFQSLGIDPDYFTRLDHQLNINVYLNVFKELRRAHPLNAQLIRRLINPSKQNFIHGGLFREISFKSSLEGLFDYLRKNARRYEHNFDYVFEVVGNHPKRFEIKAVPRDHLVNFPLRESGEIGSFLCEYRKAYFAEFFSVFSGGRKVGLVERQCFFKGQHYCIYQVV